MKEISIDQAKALDKLIADYNWDMVFLNNTIIPGLFVASSSRIEYSKKRGILIEKTAKVYITLQDEHGKSMIQTLASPTYLGKIIYNAK